jgi:hypothetical protein
VNKLPARPAAEEPAFLPVRSPKEFPMNVSGLLVPVVIGTLAVVSNPGVAQSPQEEYREKAIGLLEVPQAALDAAQKALGTAPTEAKLIPGTSPQEYELEALTKSDGELSVHVLANGKVIKLEHEEKRED